MIAYKDLNIDRWLDIDLEKESKRLQRERGWNPDELSRLQVAAGVNTFEDTYPEEVIEESQLQAAADELDQKQQWMTEMVTRVYDQDGEPSCVSNAMLQCHQIIQVVQFGKEFVIDLSQISVYRWVGSRNSGSTLSDNTFQVGNVGALPLNSERNKKLLVDTNIVPANHLFPGNGYGTKFPDDWKNTAKLFRIDEIVKLRTYAGFITCLIKGFPVMYARKGHCITGARWIRQRKVVSYINSWGDWGDRCNDELGAGMGYDSEGTIRSAANGAYAVRSIIVAEPVWGIKKTA